MPMAGGNGGRLVPLGLMGGPEEVATAGRLAGPMRATSRE